MSGCKTATVEVEEGFVHMRGRAGGGKAGID
jgi:hypothetical protein